MLDALPLNKGLPSAAWPADYFCSDTPLYEPVVDEADGAADAVDINADVVGEGNDGSGSIDADVDEEYIPGDGQDFQPDAVSMQCMLQYKTPHCILHHAAMDATSDERDDPLCNVVQNVPWSM